MARKSGLRLAGLVGGAALAAAVLLACASAQTATMHMQQAPDTVQRGIDLYNQGRYADAEAALRGQAGAEASAYLAASIAKQGSAEQQNERKQARLAEAEGLAKTALDQQPTHVVAAQALGEALVGEEKLDEAISRLTAVLNAKPDVAYAYYWRGKAYNIKHDAARMVDDFQKFLQLAPGAPEAPPVRALLSALR
jgi:tetratricopeptide (TPR) repeat protein